MRRYRIGRADTNDIVLLKHSVSREHAELTKLSCGIFSLRDLGSSYGTSAKLGSDWTLISVAKVKYDTPIRIGEFDTTVAHLLRDVDPIAVYIDSAPLPPWATPAPRLSPTARAQHPETVHIDWVPDQRATPTVAPPPQPQADAAHRHPAPESKRVVMSLLAGIGEILIVGLVTIAVALVI